MKYLFYKFGIRTRLTLLYLVLFGSSLLIFSAILYYEVLKNHNEAFDSALYNYAVDLSHSVKMDFFGALSLSPHMMEEEEKIFPFSLGDSFVLMRDSAGKLVAHSRGARDFDSRLSEKEKELLHYQKALFKTLSGEKLGVPTAHPSEYRMVSMRMSRGLWELYIQVLAPRVLLERERATLLTFFWLAIPLLLLTATLGAAILSRRALAPVKGIIDKAQILEASNLSQRVPVPESRDEIRSLALTLNALLDRLEKAFQRESNFIAYASHQLKTPLAILRGELDVLRQQKRSPEEMNSFLLSASQEIESLSKLVENLLILFQVESDRSLLAKQKTRWDDVLIETVAQLERLTKEKNLRVSIQLIPLSADPNFELTIDSTLLKCLTYNLIENAVKYSPANSMIKLELKEHENAISFSVLDEGPGINPKDVPLIFQSFYRSPSVAQEKPGHGLGLSLVDRIAKLYQGLVKILPSQEGIGAHFLVQIPKNFPVST